jgi:hypothetical protein
MMNFAAAMAILDQRMDLAGDEVDAGQQADCAVALIFMIAREGRVQAGLGRQVRSRRGDRLDTGLFVAGNDRHCIAWLLLRCAPNALALATQTQICRISPKSQVTLGGFSPIRTVWSLMK